MKSIYENSMQPNILGNGDLSSNREILARLLKLWRQKLGYFSILTAFPALFASHVQEARADEAKTPVLPVPVAGQTVRLLERTNKSCSKPELLRRQSNYLLPHQKGKYDIVSAFTGGGDNCPGVAIPRGVYSAAAPFVDTGDTTGANSTISNLYYDYVGGPDLIYSFTLASLGASPEIRVTPASPTYNPAIYIVDDSGCPAGTGNGLYYESWVLSDSFGPGAAETVNVSDLPLNVPLHLFIDSGAAGNSGPYTLRMQDVAIASGPRTKFDFDGDSKADISVFRPSEGNWYLNRSTAGFDTLKWGVAGDQLVPGDFDGDGKTDTAVFRPAADPAPDFYILNSNGYTFTFSNWGEAGDRPLAGDFDGDGKADIAVFRPSNNTWFFKNNIGLSSTVFGASGDLPVPGDYDGDGRTDMAVFRPSTGEWRVRNSNGAVNVSVWGVAGDIPVEADYDGDGTDDLAIYRPSEGRWYIRGSQAGMYTVNWGIATDIPVPGDYDGDGKTDPAVYRDGTWYVLQSTNGISVQQFGIAGDKPVPAAYLP